MSSKKLLRLFVFRVVLWGMLGGVIVPGVPGIVAAPEQPMKPNLKYPALPDYERAIKEPGVILSGEHVILFAPRRLEPAARIVHEYLKKAYDELYRIVGIDTKYRIVVYHFPPGDPNALGGTSECVIYYDYANLDLAHSREWMQHHVPHVSGYIEEMAHNFVDAAHVQFGWEMVGWSLGAQVSMKLAGNPILARQVADTRRRQGETFARYQKLGYTFPADIESNLCDQVHAWILYSCEQKYGSAFWPDFFTQVRKESQRLADAARLGDGDRIRNARYRITVECFDRLPGLEFRKLLAQNGISLNVDIKSLHPTEVGWNRKFIESGPETAPAKLSAKAEANGAPKVLRTDIPKVDPDTLPPLHKAAYRGEGAIALIAAGADVHAKGPHGWTPLHLAAMAGHQAMAEFLVGKGAGLQARDDQGCTPIDLAAIYGHEGLTALLRGKEPVK